MNSSTAGGHVDVSTGEAFCFPHSLSVFFPAYNDALALPPLVAKVVGLLRRVATNFEVIVVNDGSTDATAEVLAELAGEYAPHLRVVTHEQNRGYGGALRSGFAAATKEYVFYTDGDGQYDPLELETLLRAVTPATALVNGYKIERHDPWHRVAIGATYNQVARWMFRVQLRDIDCDFRLIRRRELAAEKLQSTGGTICIEIVRNLELSGGEVVEVPVHHYPRLHGSSQFFRLRSLWKTFIELWGVYLRLVFGPMMRDEPERRPGWRVLAAVALLVTGLTCLAYARSMALPFISDTYLQIHYGRLYGPFSGWEALARDALYRCRATSLILTYWTERLWGTSPQVFRATGMGLHVLCSLLVFALGSWRPIGWRLAAVAACFFAVSQRHAEAVIWYAALPELLVFLFSMASLLCWIYWLQHGASGVWPYGMSLGAFVLALFSKESAVAVVPLCLLAATLHRFPPRKSLVAQLPFGVLAVGYFVSGYLARASHQHFNDGTFSLSAPAVAVLVRSMGGLLWIWGWVALAAIGMWKFRRWRTVAVISFAWMAITLAPYSFLVYMPRVPSRHTYFASAGLALLVGAGALTITRQFASGRRRWLIPALAGLVVAHQTAYLWTYKQRQYALRAEPTEALIRAAQTSDGPIYMSCFPYSPEIAQQAMQVRLNQTTRPVVLLALDQAGDTRAMNLCNEVAHSSQ